ncbi:hypothetical protein HOP50_13g70600 [Chloropicon primus]|uniref:Uncharacterized protein n=1 Tax=Chloropicon primus TaxID=1764295 RepID=A0A5B8MY64_9CHLO|nr:hypothetical protein A3770_13p70400 [Chloropicon primus]UPR03730.1 hypothetical protein HOP50_13g70600 [Chloropicon primus]|eukprot:QDZ24522.1 hypothetical protein A3770_13p70400 [Chloropicon primus]
MADFGGSTRRRFSSSGRSRFLENETILLEKKLAELRTVRQVDNDQMDSRLTSKATKFIWQGGRSGKLRQFKYGKLTKEAEERMKPHAPKAFKRVADAKDQSEKENHVAEKSVTPPRVKKETHSIEISTSPIPILEEDLSNPHEPEDTGLWFPGASCVPRTPEKHEMCVGTEDPRRSKKINSFEDTFMSTRRKTGTLGLPDEKQEQKPLVNSYFAKLYLAKSLRKDKEEATPSG